MNNGQNALQLSLPIYQQSIRMTFLLFSRILGLQLMLAKRLALLAGQALESLPLYRPSLELLNQKLALSTLWEDTML